MPLRRRNLAAIIASIVCAGAIGGGAIVLTRSEGIRSAIKAKVSSLMEDEDRAPQGIEIQVGVDPPDIPVITLGNAAFETRDYERAIEFYTAALKDPRLSVVERQALMIRRGTAYGFLGREAEARAEFEALPMFQGRKSGNETSGSK